LRRNRLGRERKSPGQRGHYEFTPRKLSLRQQTKDVFVHWSRFLLLELRKSKGKRQKAKGKNEDIFHSNELHSLFFIFAFCLLIFFH